MKFVESALVLSLSACVLLGTGCMDPDESTDRGKVSQHAAFVYEVADGDTIRCTATPPDDLSAEIKQRYHIAIGLNVGVLSCMDAKAEDIQASYRITGAAAQSIVLEKLSIDAYPTWIGTYDDSTSLPLQFDIVVTRPGIEAIALSFDTRSD
ncbi:MAG: hypothetical protein ACI82A_002037 [Candidatus Azotimanducaceae bacterium]|jgi:hypothetical protein